MSEQRLAPRLNVLLIDDDARLFGVLCEYMRENEIELVHASDGTRGLKTLESNPFDAVLLDVMMPGLSGLEVVRRIRKRSSVPIIMLTARGDEADRVVGLELGADDYVPKPFSPRELLARLRAVLRRTQPQLSQQRLSVCGIDLDASTREVSHRGKRIELTGLQFDILFVLMRRAGRVVPRDSLLAEAGRSDVTVSARTVDVHISHLRKKLGDDPRSPRLIKTIRSVGYLFGDG